MIILDTDHVGYYLKGDSPESVALRANIDNSPDSVATTIVSLEEQMRGWLAAIRRNHDPHDQIRHYRSLQNMFTIFQDWTIVPWDTAAADIFCNLKAAKIRIGTMDLKIASIALAHGATLLTRNLRDFGQVPNLKAEDWTV